MNVQSAADGDPEDTIGGASDRKILKVDTSYSSGDDESSHWSDGKGWKNVAGKYIAMVDFDGSDTELCSDGNIVNLAVAGVNRIGALTGDCSYRITGTGIVLIDSIDIGEGRYLTLGTNTALYTEGSAAVFVLQEDGTYRLINEGITGILDEDYSLEDVRLVVPDGSSLTLSAIGIRSETWTPAGSSQTVTDTTIYPTLIPDDAGYPTHENGNVTVKEYASRLILGNNSTLIVENGGSVMLKGVSRNMGANTTAAEMVIRGSLDVRGIVEGGILDISDGGSLSGSGKVQSSKIKLAAGGSLSEDLLLEGGSLTISNLDLDKEPSVSATVKDSVIYLNGYGITVPELNVRGNTRLVVQSLNFGLNEIGNIDLSPQNRLEILSDEHDYYYAGQWRGTPRRILEDCFLEINGTITGGTVSALAGFVYYTGKKTDVLPLVPDGYASRVLISDIDMESSLNPLNMTQKEAFSRVTASQIPVLKCDVIYSQESDGTPARSWIKNDIATLAPLSKDKKDYTCESFMQAYDLHPEEYDYTSDDYHPAGGYPAVEVIYCNLEHEVYWLGDPETFSADDGVLMIRMLYCSTQGGQGGSSVSHVSTSHTGSGVIGGPGSGSVHVGASAIVYSNGQPVPEEPEEDSNVDNNSDNNSGNGNTDVNTNTKTKTNTNTNTRTDTVVTRKAATKKKTAASVVSAVKAGGFIVTITVREPDAADPAKSGTETQRIWNLAVTRGGAAVTDLAGNAVKAVFRFTVPEAWGDPSQLPEDSLYAVFADENGELTAYSAQYDPYTGEISFETETSGDFVIVLFEYDAEPFTEDFYRALADLEEIRSFISI